MRNRILSSLRTSALVAMLGAGSLGCGSDDSAMPSAGSAANLTPPTEFSADVLNQPAVHLTWKDAPNEHHYTIERKVGTGAFTKLATKDRGADAHHDDKDIVKGTTYSYRISSGGPNGEMGAWSPEISATVPQ